MAQVHPLGEPEAIDLEFQYRVSDEWIEKTIRDEGIRMPLEWTVQFSLPEVPPPLRIRLYQAHRRYMKTPGFPTFFAPTEDPEVVLEAVEAWIEASGEGAPDDGSFDRLRTTWVEDHGSERLRAAQRRGYKINRLYAVERAAKEFPEFWIDTSNEATVRERTDPSMLALELEDAARERISDHDLDDSLEPRIVWLIEPPKALEEHIEESEVFFEQQEALLIANYLGRYSLVMPVDRDLRNSGTRAVDG